MDNSTNTMYEAFPSDEKFWNSHIHHPLQSWEWGEFRKKMGIDVTRYVRKKNTDISECWQITFHSIPHTPFTIGYFPKGPQPDQFMINELKKIGLQKNALYIQIEPNIEHSVKYRFDDFQLCPSHHPLFTKYTFEIDISKSEEDLLKNMHSKTRYNIKLAQKHSVVIKEESNNQAFESYIALSEETTRRQGFYAHNKLYHQTMWDTMKEKGLAKLFTARYQNEILCTWIIFCLHDTLYYPYGASSRNHREVMAPNLMLWEVIRWGKSQGYKKFDLWGAIGPNPDPKDPWYGFHRFKEGYNPKLIEYIGSFDLVIKPLLYNIFCIGDNFRWKILKIKSNFRKT